MIDSGIRLLDSQVQLTDTMFLSDYPKKNICLPQKRYYMTSEYLEIKHTSCTNCFYGAFAFILKLESSSSHIMQAKGNKLQYIIYKILMEWHCIFAFVDKLIL